MKLLEATNTIEQIGNITEENTFKMKSSRKAFQILSDLYSDKPLAIVRELGCNAMDSHIASGQPDRPFHIHLPNTLEPWLSIQDFGTGISHENIYNIYATYFESTKTNTNDQIGCLGLGSKSPFCYSDNFVVTSIHDGIKRSYNAFFNSNNTPAISLMSTSNTSESNGITIQIPIKEKDHNDFINAVRKAFRFFDVKPIISGGKVEWKEEKPMFQGKGWRSYSEFDESFAIMGGVTYPIDNYKLKDEYYSMLRKGGLVLYFDMGEVDFVPSREALSYCDDTINAINNKLKFVQKDFICRVNDMIADQPTLLEALNCVHTLRNKFAYIQGMTISDKIVWKGQDISNPVEFLRKIAKDGRTLTYKKPSYYRKKITESIYPSLDSLWVYDDLDRGSIIKIKFYVQTNEDKSVTVFNKDAYTDMIATGFPASAFVLASSMPSPVRAKRNNSGGTRQSKVKGVFNVYKLGNTDNKSWEPDSLDANNPNVKFPKYYIVKNPSDWNFSITLNKLNRTINTKSELDYLTRFLKIDEDDIVMIAEQNVKHLPKTSKVFKDFVSDMDFSFDADKLATANSYRTNFETIKKHKLFSKITNSEFVDMVNYINESSKELERVRPINHWLDDSKGNVKKSKDALVQKILDKCGSYGWDMDLMLEIMLRFN